VFCNTRVLALLRIVAGTVRCHLLLLFTNPDQLQGVAHPSSVFPEGVSEAVRLPEAAFFHKASRTLLVTDAVVYVARDPPAVIPSEVSSSCQALSSVNALSRFAGALSGW
jgi:hypothetical protein